MLVQEYGECKLQALQFTLKRTTGPLTVLASYTYGKSLDQSSSIQEQVYPYNYREEYAPSAFPFEPGFPWNQRERVGAD
jgi:hypothetical protein